jgi:murein DD-endopeptidase MepM/ murein hydrolase activator NlpD
MRLLPLILLLAACGTGNADVDTDLNNSTSVTTTTDTGDPTSSPDGWLWPIPGEDGADWVIHNYIDLAQYDPDILDYAGGANDDAKTYDDHRGIDINISSFRAMDAGISIVAVVGGEVVETTDGEFDRATECVSYEWNSAIVESDDGYLMYYGHMRNGSVAVSTGDRVEVGDLLGLVGSSGCSDGPHLHFEVWEGETLIDPFQDALWANPPVYDTPMSLMDGFLKAGPFQDFIDIQDPGPQATSIQLGQELGVGVSVAGGSDGDEMNVIIVGPGGQWDTLVLTFDQTWRHSMWYWNISPDARGSWSAEFRIDGDLQETHNFDVQ